MGEGYERDELDDLHGKEDAEVARHWLRKVERVINQMQVPEDLRVDCVTRLLVESAHS
jgi:hypothetical protein